MGYIGLVIVYVSNGKNTLSSVIQLIPDNEVNVHIVGNIKMRNISPGSASVITKRKISKSYTLTRVRQKVITFHVENGGADIHCIIIGEGGDIGSFMIDIVDSKANASCII